MPGALITALLFLLGKQLVGLYFAETSLDKTHSAAGSPVVVLLWVYYSAQLFFWGPKSARCTPGPWIACYRTSPRLRLALAWRSRGRRADFIEERSTLLLDAGSGVEVHGG